MARQRHGGGQQFIENPRACLLPKGAAFGDQRYRYKNWWCLTPEEKRSVAGSYVYKTPGIPDSAYAYPVNKSGRLAHARRALVWGLKRVKAKVARSRAA